MGLRDKASKVLGALRRGDGREAAESLGDAIGAARVRIMDGMVSRLSGHPVSTATGDSTRQEDLPTAEAPAPVTEPAPEVAAEPTPVVAPDPVAEPAAAEPVALKGSKRKASAALDDLLSKRPAKVEPAPAPSSPEAASEPASAASPAPEAPTPPAYDPPEAAALPRGYSENRLVLLARDPIWAFAHWDFARERLDAVGAGLKDPRAALRFFEVGNPTALLDADVEPENGRYYLRVPRPGRTYEAVIVLVGADGETREVARSNEAEPPSRRPSEEVAAPRFVRMDAQTSVLDRAEEVTVPPPRLVMNAAGSQVAQPSFQPRSARWAAVIARVRRRRLVESMIESGAVRDDGSGAGLDLETLVEGPVAARLRLAPSSSAGHTQDGARTLAVDADGAAPSTEPSAWVPPID